VVDEGQVLFEISSERITRDGGVEMRSSSALHAQRELATVEAEAQLLQLMQRRQELHARRALFLDEARIIEQERGLQRRRLEIAAEMLQRTRSLREQGFVSAAQVAQAEGEQLEHHTKLQAVERSRLVSLREQAQAELDLAQIERQADIIRLQAKRNQAVLEQGLAEHQARMRVRILAQAAGKLTAIAVRPGDTVEAGANLATIIPRDGAFEAHLAVPSAAIGFASANQEVRMRVAAYPYQRFGYLTGKVRVVEHGPLAEGPVGNKEGTEPFYRIAVSLDRQTIYANGKERPFKPGMRLEAVIRQDRRRLIHWMLDPVRNAIKAPMT
jgi:membrane fusion protein